MIKKLPESGGNLLAFSAAEKLTAADYEESFIPQLEQCIQRYGKIKLLILFTESFSGWELAAMWDDARFGMQHKNDFARIAIVGKAPWLEWAARLGSYFMPGQVKAFANHQFIDAMNWLSEQTE